MLMTWIYLASLALCYIVDNKMTRITKTEQRDRHFLITSQFLFVIYFGLMIGFRDLSVGADTQGYVEAFEQMKYKTFAAIFDSDGRSKEYLFEAIAKIIYMWTGNRFVYTTFFAMAFSMAYGYTVHKLSDNYFISYVVLLVLYMSFIISGMRQVAAMSILLLSYPLIKKRKLIPFLFCVALAYFFHNTSVIFVIAYFMANKKMGWLQISIIAAALILTYALPGVTKNFLYETIAWEKLEIYESYERTVNVSGFIIKMCIFAFNLYHYKAVVKKNENNLFLYNMAALGVALEAFTVIMSQAFRMSMYFSIFDTILLANVVQDFETNKQNKYSEKILTFVLVVGLLAIYYFIISQPLVYKMGIFGG